MGTTKTYGLGGGVAGTSEIDDDLDPSVLIESADGKDYIEIDTTDSAEVLTLAGGAADVHVKGTLTMLDEKKIQMFKSGEGVSAYPRLEFTAASTSSIVSKTGTNHLYLGTNSTNRLNIDHLGKIATGNETSALCAAGGLHLKIADSGLAAPNGSFDDLVIEHSGATGLTFSAPANSGIRFQKDGNTDHHGITFDSGTSSIRTRLGAVDRLYIDDAGRVKWQSSGVQYHAGTGNDDAATEPLYLTGSGANLIIDCRKGNYGDVTLTANVTAVKFLFRPDDGNVFTMTAKIKQGSSVYEIDYSDSAVTVYAGDGTGSASTGEMKWAGNVPHTIGATGTTDIVQFTIFPNGTTFDVFAAVIGQDFS